MALYSKQKQIVDDLFAHYVQSNKRFALLTSEVGTGKTYMASALSEKFTNVLIIVPNHLGAKWSEVLEEFNSDATLFVLPKRGKGDLNELLDVEEYDLIIWDEVHEAKSRLYYLDNANFSNFLGLSGSIIDKRPADLKNIIHFFSKKMHMLEEPYSYVSKMSDREFSKYIITNFKYVYTIGCTREDIEA